MEVDLFIYFRAPAAQAAAVRSAVEAMQARLRADVVGLETHLFKRADGSNTAAELTWMETYTCEVDAGPVEAAASLVSRIDMLAASWRHLLSGERHVEVFERCA